MPQLFGEFYCNIDDKGRLRLPSAFIEQLGLPQGSKAEFILGKGHGRYLRLYTLEEYIAFKADIDKRIDPFNMQHRRVAAMLTGGVDKKELDSSDRILINKNLLEWSKIQKEVIIAPIINEITIWAKEEYEAETTIDPDDFSGLVNEVLGNKQ